MEHSRHHILRQTEAYYTKKVVAHGATAQGVDWNSEASQQLRFAQLLRLVEGTEQPFSINDFGCGYGALIAYLYECGYDFVYHGYDLSTQMINHARERYGHLSNCHFSTSLAGLEPAQYTVASGIFNVKLDTATASWSGYVLDTLDQLADLSRQGFAFNVLTRYADAERMRPELYYADPGMLFDHCQRHYSRWVALLHDYGLYEFTVLVRKHGGG